MGKTSPERKGLSKWERSSKEKSRSPIRRSSSFRRSKRNSRRRSITSSKSRTSRRSSSSSKRRNSFRKRSPKITRALTVGEPLRMTEHIRHQGVYHQDKNNQRFSWYRRTSKPMRFIVYVNRNFSSQFFFQTLRNFIESSLMFYIYSNTKQFFQT